MPTPEEQQENSKAPHGAHLAEYQWKPGQSGNPGGRPKGRSITALLREALEEPDDDGSGKTAADRIVEVAIRLARSGDFRFWNAIVERVDGKVPSKIEVDDVSGLSDADLLSRLTQAVRGGGPPGPDAPGR